MIPNWVFPTVVLALIVFTSPFIVLSLFMPPWFRAWYLKLQYGAVTVKDLGETYVDGKNLVYKSENLLECTDSSHKTFYILHLKTQGNAGIGMMSIFKRIPAKDVRSLLPPKR